MSGELSVFFREKLRGYSLPLLLRLEFESLVFGVASFVPTTFGVCTRALLANLFFKSCRGLCWIQPGVTLVHTERITVGKTFGVNSGAYINGVGGIDIGNSVLIGSNVTISSGKHPIDGIKPVFSRQSIPSKIIIEDDVWIGAGAVIMPGITLAKGSVIGANSVVTKDTIPYSINAGTPAKLLRMRI
jgi:maltose O-acetyltransferase